MAARSEHHSTRFPAMLSRARSRVATWARKGQLGSSPSQDLSRETGGRI